MCFILLANNSLSQTNIFESGLPHILNYTKNNHKAHDQNWCLLEDSLGLIYIGNNAGLLVFDGIEFDFLATESVIYSLAKDGKGNIFYGADGDFGLIKQNESGKLIQESLIHLIPKGFDTFAEVWTIKCIDNQVFFSTNEHIYAFKNDIISIIKPAKGTSIHKCFELKNNYLVREIGGGFSYLLGNKLTFIKGSEIFEEIKVDFVQEIDGKILVGTRKNGFYEMTWDPSKSANSCVLTPIKFPVSKYFEEDELYSGILLSNGNLCLTTKSNGVFISDLQGNLLEHYTINKGIVNNKTWHALEDRNKNLWVVSSKGISMIDYLIPIRQYDAVQGLSGLVNNINVINDKLYASCDVGLFEGSETNEGIVFKPNPNFKTNCFSVSKFSKDGINDIIVASQDGLAAIRGNEKITIEEGIRFDNSLQCAKNPNLLVAVGKNIITLYKFINKQYKLIREFEHLSQFRFIVEDDDGYLWISGDNKVLVKVNPSLEEKSVFELIPLQIPINIKSENFIFKFKNKILVSSLKGIYEIKNNHNSITFLKSDLFPSDLEIQHNYVFKVYVTKKENFWLAYDSGVENGVIAQYSNSDQNNYTFDNLYFNKFRGIQKNGFGEDKYGNLWIATNDGLLKYDTKKQINHKYKFPIFIKKVTLKNDSAFSLTRGLIPSILIQPLPFDLNDISFKFSAANYSGVEDIFFSSRLMPIEDNFGEWTLLRNKNYSYLPEGKYTLEVKAKDIFNNYSSIKKFTFEIAPPYYRTKLAYFLYAVLAIVLIYGLIKFNTIRLRAVNDLLEKTVKDRTHELWEERDKLHEANLEITDSINYAKIIQQSILPDVKTFKKTFTDSFILFKPRNIVSGDFYWFSLADATNKTKFNLNQHIIVAADCTGHGVPGAFMSMIGSEKLNQSIAEIDDLTPSSMLSFMNRKIKDSLKQEEGTSQSKDGMEISLCFIDLETNRLIFAGANRPLWIYRKGGTLENVEIIKPTKAGIAGHTNADQVFEETEIQLYKDDTIYLFTDGAPDQFGGPKNKKLTTKGLRQLLFDIQSQTMEQQGKAISGFYRNWMGNANEQVDDILIMGIRI
jgi:serine phosphatase RsbU (regulator of sigma subunit)/ligand-binding sensor domain-containing protein